MIYSFFNSVSLSISSEILSINNFQPQGAYLLGREGQWRTEVKWRTEGTRKERGKGEGIEEKERDLLAVCFILVSAIKNKERKGVPGLVVVEG